VVALLKVFKFTVRTYKARDMDYKTKPRENEEIGVAILALAVIFVIALNIATLI
jgi:hypothetical protein